MKTVKTENIPIAFQIDNHSFAGFSGNQPEREVSIQNSFLENDRESLSQVSVFCIDFLMLYARFWALF